MRLGGSRMIFLVQSPALETMTEKPRSPACDRVLEVSVFGGGAGLVLSGMVTLALLRLLGLSKILVDDKAGLMVRSGCCDDTVWWHMHPAQCVTGFGAAG